jgi:hypothetical protein
MNPEPTFLNAMKANNKRNQKHDYEPGLAKKALHLRDKFRVRDGSKPVLFDLSVFSFNKVAHGLARQPRHNERDDETRRHGQERAPKNAPATPVRNASGVKMIIVAAEEPASGY